MQEAFGKRRMRIEVQEWEVEFHRWGDDAAFEPSSCSLGKFGAGMGKSRFRIEVAPGCRRYSGAKSD